MMWNHSSKKTARPVCGDFELQKHLDLTNYLNYLQNLFSLSTSDSEASDEEISGDKKGEINKQGLSSLPSISCVAGLGEDESFGNLPVSDTELNNLLKKGDYLGEVVDPRTFDNLGDVVGDQHEDDGNLKEVEEKTEDKKKKKKRKPKKKVEEIKSQNRPNSGGRGNSGGSGTSSKGGSSSSSGGNGGSSGQNSSSNCNNNNGTKNNSSTRRSSSGGSSSNKSSSGGGSQLKQFNSNGNGLVRNSFKTKTCSASSSSTSSRSSSSLKGNISPDFDPLFTSSRRSFSNHFVSSCSSSSGLCLRLRRKYDDESDNDKDSSDDSDDNDSILLNNLAVQSTAPPSSGLRLRNDVVEEMDFPSSRSSSSTSSKSTDEDCGPLRKRRKREDVNVKKLSFIELMDAKRKSIFTNISIKEIPKAQRIMSTTHKQKLTANKMKAQFCSRFIKLKHQAEQESPSKTKHTQDCVKQAGRADKEVKKQREKEEEEQRKLDLEALELRKYQRQLNFLLTQSELYANIIHHGEDDVDKVLENTEGLDDEDTTSHDMEKIKSQARVTVQEAIAASRRVRKDVTTIDKDEPSLFCGELRPFQKRGVDWILHFYENGVNVVLADESGLGKTVESIAVLASIAETYGLWGPFLIIVPSSSLHFCQQEISRFVPKFKTVPYWGSPQERKILRQFWTEVDLHQPSASFHVVITSSNIVNQDLKYFNKVKWQFLIVDEAKDDVKGTLRDRLKTLKGLSCQNRLVLLPSPLRGSGTNELLSLLNFIMPFTSAQDDHSADITLDETFSNSCKTRLESVLQQFTLHRTLADVEVELCDKVETLVPCPLSSRQKFFHAALMRKLLADEAVKSSPKTNPQVTRQLKRLLLQIRKVCNHPDLIELRDPKTPFFMAPLNLPSASPLFERVCLSRKERIIRNLFDIYNPVNVYYSLFGNKVKSKRKHVEDIHVANVQNSEWSFTRYSYLSVGDVHNATSDCLTERLRYLVSARRKIEIRRHQKVWDEKTDERDPKLLEMSDFLLSPTSLKDSESRLVFTSTTEPFFTWNESNSGADDVEFFNFPNSLFNIICDKVKSIQPSNDSEHIDKLFWPNLQPQESNFFKPKPKILGICRPVDVIFPEKEYLVLDSGKLIVLTSLLKRLQAEGRCLLIYSAMPRMSDVLEDFLRFNKWGYKRLDNFGINNSESSTEVFVYLSTPECPCGTYIHQINTIVYYDSDFSFMDQSKITTTLRLCQNQTLMVYKLFSKGTVEERAVNKMNILKMEKGNAPEVSEQSKSKGILKLLIEDDMAGRNAWKIEDVTKTVKETACSPVSPQKDVVSHEANTPRSLKHSGSSGCSGSLSSPSSPNENDSDFLDCEMKEFDVGTAMYDEEMLEITLSAADYYEGYSKTIDWSNGSSDCDEDLPFVPTRPKLGRGSGKRGRPPSRVRVQMRELTGDSLSLRRGPGRPRLKPIGPLNQGMRGMRRPGRPPLSRKIDSIPGSPRASPSNRIIPMFPPQSDVDLMS